PSESLLIVVALSKDSLMRGTKLPVCFIQVGELDCSLFGVDPRFWKLGRITKCLEILGEETLNFFTRIYPLIRVVSVADRLALTVSKTGSLVCGEKYRFAFLLSVNERLRVFQDGEKYRLPHIFQLEGSRIRFDDYPSRLIDIVHYICCDFELHLFP